MIKWSQLGSKDANSSGKQRFISFHDLTTLGVVKIVRFVRVGIIGSLVNKIVRLSSPEGQVVGYL